MRRASVVLLLLVCALVCSAGPAAGRPAKALPAAPSGCGTNRPGMKFDDEFSSRAGLRPWTALTGNYDSADLQQYRPSALSIRLSQLDITARRTSTGYTSGRVSTVSSCKILYGNIQARIWTPAGQGLWPAFWLVDHGDRHELDVMESVGQRPDVSYAAVHTATTDKSYQTTGKLAGAWHVYGLLWTSKQIKFSVDKHVFGVAPNTINSPLYMVLNLAVGGSWAGPPDASTQFPAVMKVDWVRVYKLGHGG